MLTGASGGTATLLRDGRVLFTGGDTTDGIVADAEMYDPQTKQFTTTPSLLTPRWHQTATRLRDGRILVAGGTERTGLAAVTDGSPGLSSAELFH